MIASGIIQLACLAATYVVYAADGCFGPLNALTNQCRWKPSNGWTGMTLLADSSLITVGFLSACAALVGGVAARAGRLRAPTGTVAVPTGHDDVRPRLARSAVAAALSLAAAATLLTTFTITQANPTASSDPPTLNTGLLSPPSAARSVLIRKWQMQAWELHGGYNHIERLADQARTLGDVVTKALNEPRDERGRIPLDTKLLLELCGALEEQVAQAQRYFPIPDPDTQAIWSSGLADIAQGSRDCQAALSGTVDGQRFFDALEDIATAFEVLAEASERVSEIAGRSATPTPGT